MPDITQWLIVDGLLVCHNYHITQLGQTWGQTRLNYQQEKLQILDSFLIVHKLRLHAAPTLLPEYRGI